MLICLKALVKFSTKEFSEQKLISEIVIYLIISKVLISILPFRKLVEKFELSRKANHHRTRKNLGTAQIKQISNLIEASAEQLPFECKCFPRAITGKWLLSKQGIKTNLKLGLAKGLKPEKPLLAHAWLVHKGEIIIGRSKTEFCEVGNF